MAGVSLSSRRFYRDLIKKHGDTLRGVGWGDIGMLDVRFSVLAEVDAMSRIDHAEIIDAGCGTGLMYQNFRRNGLIEEPHNYIGIDVEARSLEFAQARNPMGTYHHGIIQEFAGAGMFEGDGLEGHYVFANGIFNHAGDAESLSEVVSAMWRMARRAVAFNCLSDWAPEKRRYRDERRKLIAFHDPIKTLEICRGIAPFVTLRHDYLDNDFTIYMYRRPRRLE